MDLSAGVAKTIGNLVFATRCSTERRYLIEKVIEMVHHSRSLADQSMREMEQQRGPPFPLPY